MHPNSFKQYEIPGFEGYRFAQGKSTSHAKKLLTNKDAILLIINEILSADRECPTKRKDMATTRLIAERFQNWRGLQYPWSVNNSLAAYYLNMSYGHVGSYKYTAYYSLPSATRDRKEVPTWWYRVKHGHYALTDIGVARVHELIVDAESMAKAKLRQHWSPRANPATGFATGTLGDLIREKLGQKTIVLPGQWATVGDPPPRVERWNECSSTNDLELHEVSRLYCDNGH